MECPKCLMQFKLKKYLPGRRVICIRCRAVIEIPEAEGPPLPPPVPEEKKGPSSWIKDKRPLVLILLIASAVACGLALALLIP